MNSINIDTATQERARTHELKQQTVVEIVFWGRRTLCPRWREYCCWSLHADHRFLDPLFRPMLLPFAPIFFGGVFQRTTFVRTLVRCHLHCTCMGHHWLLLPKAPRGVSSTVRLTNPLAQRFHPCD
jgi:hypothetical protein